MSSYSPLNSRRTHPREILFLTEKQVVAQFSAECPKYVRWMLKLSGLPQCNATERFCSKLLSFLYWVVMIQGLTLTCPVTCRVEDAGLWTKNCIGAVCTLADRMMAAQLVLWLKFAICCFEVCALSAWDSKIPYGRRVGAVWRWFNALEMIKARLCTRGSAGALAEHLVTPEMTCYEVPCYTDRPVSF